MEERKLSKACMETLAIIAYHQPITRAEIENIRGVDRTDAGLLIQNHPSTIWGEFNPDEGVVKYDL